MVPHAFKKRLRIALVCLSAAGHALIGGPNPAAAQGVIRDAEIEHTLRAIATPLLQAAGLAPEGVRIIMLNDKRLNAFVARGQNIFFHAGLLMRAESSSEIAGVMAHEIGHIAGGHLARLDVALDNMAMQNFLAIIVGAAAGALAGDPGVGAAVMGGGQSMALRNTLGHTRLEESSADQAGIRYLRSVGWSADGFMRFMQTLAQQESLLAGNQDPYMRTHPVTRDRVATIRAFVEGPGANLPKLPPALDAAMERVRAKLIGYLEGRAAVGRFYPSWDQSASAQYARAIAAFRAGDLREAETLTKALSASAPNDPYYIEFLGDIAVGARQFDQAAAYYRKSVSIAPEQALLYFSLGRALVQIGSEQAYREAAVALRRGLRWESTNPLGWRDFSIALGRLGETGRADLAYANYASLIGNHQLALNKAEAAKRALPPGDPARLRASDLIAASQNSLRRARER